MVPSSQHITQIRGRVKGSNATDLVADIDLTRHACSVCEAGGTAVNFDALEKYGLFVFYRV